MTVVYYQAGILFSIPLAFYLGKLLRHRIKFARYLGFAATCLWLLWTTVQLQPPLFYFQGLEIIIVSIISYRVMRSGHRQEKEIQSLKNELQQSDNARLRAEAEKIAAGKIEVLETALKHREFFLSTLRKAKDTVVILSGWATDYAVNEEFRVILRKALQRGVNVYIGYGYQRKGEKEQEKDYERRARETLAELQNWCSTEKLSGRIHVFHYPNHAKILIKDDTYAVNGGFNWLSNKGGSQNEERSWIVYNYDFVTSERDEIIASLEDPLTPKRRNFLKKFLPWSDY